MSLSGNPKRFRPGQHQSRAQRRSFLFWRQTEKGGMDGEATVSGAIPTLACHPGEGVGTDPVVRSTRLGPAIPSVSAPRHSGSADGRVCESPAHGLAMRALDLGRMVLVETAQDSRFRERASAVFTELLES